MVNEYIIDKFFVCTVTGEVLTNRRLNGKAYTKTFDDIKTATTYLDNEKKDWLMLSLENWVNHKAHIIKANPTADKEKALQVCRQALATYATLPSKQIAIFFIRGQQWFNNLLPSPSNPSFQSSYQNLNGITNFCLKEMAEAEVK